LTYKKKS